MANASLTRLAAITVWAAFAAAAPAVAQCRLCAPTPAAAKKPPTTAISIEIEAGIDFSRLGLIARNQAGNAVIDPDTGQRTVTGLLDLSGLPIQGTVIIRGEPNEHVAVTLPPEVTLSNSAGGTVRLTAITTSLRQNPKLEKDGTMSFSFGGRLEVDGSGDGDFRGRVPITVDYR